MNGIGRAVLIGLGVVLLLPGVCSTLCLPIVVMSVPSLFSKNGEEAAYARMFTLTWSVGAALGVAGFFALRRTWRR